MTEQCNSQDFNSVNCDSFVMTDELVCAYKTHYYPWTHDLFKGMLPDTSLIDTFFNGIVAYDSSITDGDGYDCDVLVVDKGVVYKSLENENKRYPHDRKAWNELGSLSDMFKVLFDPESGLHLTLPYWETCISDGCIRPYPLNATVVDKVPVLDAEGNHVEDECGNKIYEELIFTSLIDDNTDKPTVGAVKDEPTWDGGYTIYEYLNRPVGVDQNGNEIKPSSGACLLSCEAVAEPFELKEVDGLNVLGLLTGNGVAVESGQVVATIANGLEFDTDGNIQVKPANESIVFDVDGVKLGIVGVDPSGEDVEAGDTFVTEDDINTDQLEFVGGKLEVKKSYLKEVVIPEYFQELPNC